MMTEEELKELEKGAPRMALVSQQEGIYLANLHELADEVRRLNAAYAKLLHEIDTSAAINSMPFYDMARNIFEPELTE